MIVTEASFNNFTPTFLGCAAMPPGAPTPATSPTTVCRNRGVFNTGSTKCFSTTPMHRFFRMEVWEASPASRNSARLQWSDQSGELGAEFVWSGRPDGACESFAGISVRGCEFGRLGQPGFEHLRVGRDE